MLCIAVSFAYLSRVAPAHEQDPIWAAVAGAIWILASSSLLYAGVRPTALVTLLALALEIGVLLIAALVAALHPPVAAHVTAQSAPLPASFGITGLVLSTLVLLACMYAFEHLGSVQGFADNQADALAYVGSLLGGPWWRVAIVVTVLLSTLSTLWTTILYLTRSVYAMGRDGVLLRILGALDARDEPLWSMGVVAVLVTLCELVTGFSKSAAEQLTLVLNASSLFLG